MYFVYLVRCCDGTLYCGITNDLEKRVQAHNSNKGGAKYTRSRQPVCLVHQEGPMEKKVAMRRECEIKAMTRTQKLALFGG